MAIRPQLKRSTIMDWCRYVGDWRREKGFSTPAGLRTPSAAVETVAKLALVQTEICEAMEAVRSDPPDEDNFAEELADACIRIFDLCDAQGIDLEEEIARKMAVNEGRPRLHGKRF